MSFFLFFLTHVLTGQKDNNKLPNVYTLNTDYVGHIEATKWKSFKNYLQAKSKFFHFERPKKGSPDSNDKLLEILLTHMLCFVHFTMKQGLGNKPKSYEEVEQIKVSSESIPGLLWWLVWDIQITTRTNTVAGWLRISGNQWGVNFLAETSGSLTAMAVQWRKWSPFCFTQKWQQKNKQFHGLLGTVIHGLAQSHPVSSYSACTAISQFHQGTIQTSRFKK